MKSSPAEDLAQVLQAGTNRLVDRSAHARTFDSFAVDRLPDGEAKAAADRNGDQAVLRFLADKKIPGVAVAAELEIAAALFEPIGEQSCACSLVCRRFELWSILSGQAIAVCV